MAFPLRLRARGRRQHTPGVMNRLEEAYSEVLAARVQAREVAWFRYDCVKLRLADKTFYTPDFLVMLMDGTLECHEAKGFWEDDAKVKIKVAADQYPFRFVAVRRVKKQWVYEEF